MPKNFTYEASSITQWIKMEDQKPDAGLLSRCKKETVEAALTDMPHVSVVSAEIEEKTGVRPACFHVVLSEAGFGTTPATVNVWCPLNWNGRYLACTGGGIRTVLGIPFIPTGGHGRQTEEQAEGQHRKAKE